MQKSATFIKKVAKSGRGYSIRIPKDVAQLLTIQEGTVLEVILKVRGKERR